MGLNQIMVNPWFSRIILIVSIASAAAVLFLYSRIDSLVNVSLYKYNLQFSSNWYTPYQSTTQLINVCIGAVLALNVVALFLNILGKTSKSSEDRADSEHNKVNSQEIIKDLGQEEKSTVKQLNSNTNTCLNCNKTFSRPLVTLNFVNGKPKMMNTCPYCNAPIDISNNEKSQDTDIQISDEENEKVSRSRKRQGN